MREERGKEEGKRRANLVLGEKTRGNEEVTSQKRRRERWDRGEERRAGTLATVAAARSRWRSEERLWPPRLVTLHNAGQTRTSHTYSVHINTLTVILQFYFGLLRRLVSLFISPSSILSVLSVLTHECC